MGIPESLLDTVDLALDTPLPQQQLVVIDESLPTYLYNFYNLDPNWKKDESANRILLLEPSHFREYPVSAKSIDFMLNLSLNVDHMQIFVGEFKELTSYHNVKEIYLGLILTLTQGNQWDFALSQSSCRIHLSYVFL